MRNFGGTVIASVPKFDEAPNTWGGSLFSNTNQEFAVKVMIEKMSAGDGYIRSEGNAKEEGRW